jgi:hypothetical protein
MLEFVSLLLEFRTLSLQYFKDRLLLSYHNRPLLNPKRGLIYYFASVVLLLAAVFIKNCFGQLFEVFLKKKNRMLAKSPAFVPTAIYRYNF